MSIETGSVLIIDINGLVMAVAPGSAIPANTTAFLMAGTDGTNARTLSTDSSGRPVFVGAGVAGTPAGGVISIQGVSGGQAIPISGTVTATNASTGATGSAPPASATYIGGNDGTNLVGLKMKPASTAAAAADPSLVVALSPNSPLPTGANVIGSVSQNGTWSVTATQATAANLNATVVQGAAGSAAAGWFVKLTDGTNTAPTFDVAARAGFQKITDGTNTAAVKAASTAPVATDPSLVVVLSPNQQSIPVTIAAGTDRTSTGTITNTQSIAINTQSCGTCGIQVTGVWTGTLVFEGSVDNGTTWVAINVAVPSTGAELTSTTANGTWVASVAGFAQLRVRGNTVASGTATVFLDSATGSQVVTLGDPLPTGANTIGAVTQGAGSGSAATYWYNRITDGTNTMPTMDAVARKGFQAITDGTNGPAAVKAASTAAAATDPSLVVALSPNSPIPTGSNTIGVVNQGTAAAVANGWPVKVTDGTNTMPTGDVIARAIFHQITDGTNGPVAVKAASTAAVATDKALVVAISPNNTISTSNASVGATGSAPPASATYIAAFDGTNLVGLKLKPASTAAAATDPSLVVALSPNSPIPTGANVIGAVTQSGTWSVTATQAVAANLNATVVQGTASNLNATIVGSGSAGTAAAGVVTVQGIASMTPLLTQNRNATTATLTQVAGSVTSVSLLASNTNRLAAIIQNDGSSVMYVAYGATASTTAYTYRVTANSNLVIDGFYTGAISAIFSTTNSTARITELTP
jgi:hypothetical protein